jgi:hypothetical protein
MVMNKTKEIGLGFIWGALAALLIMLFIFSQANSAESENLELADGGKIKISVSADSVELELDKDGNIKSVKIGKDKFEKTTSGIRVENELIIEDGRIYIDGEEITEDELEKLSVDKEESRSGVRWQAGRHEGKYVKRKRLATVYTDTEGDVVHFSDIVIDHDQLVTGDVVSIGGDVTVYGEVEGDVVSVFGDVYLEDCYVGGDVAAPFGDVNRTEGAVVEGDVDTAEFDGIHNVDFGLGGRYNRVEGLAIFAELEYDSQERQHPSVDLTGGYAFTLKRWEYDFGVKKDFFDEWSPYIDIHMFQLAETSDKWILTEPENTFAAAILKEDFYDFYWKRGFSTEVGLTYDEDLTFGLGYTAAKMENLKRTAKKAIFGGDKKFRENWSTVLYDSVALAGVEGDLKEIELKLNLDTRDNEEEPESGIFTNLAFKKALDSDSADFEYEMLDAELKYYMPLATDQTFFFRIRVGYSDDDLPLFRRYFIGGIGSLRGYEYKEFQGNRYVLFNADYIWRFFDSSLGAGVFFDAGKAAFTGGEFEDEDLKTNIGVALLLGDGFRINLAQRLDDMDKSPVLSVRGKILF